jgi:NitT/TauT family transport system permease protein
MVWNHTKYADLANFIPDDLGHLHRAVTDSLFTLVYGYLAAYNRRAEQVLMPLLDVLQSVPILSFLPVVLLSLSAICRNVAAELASVVLIFTSQAWNMTFAWYQSLTTIPTELREASAIFRFNRWLRFKTLELPFGAISLIWNSMMSWAGGWFFLMAAEIFTVGQRDFRLPGLGAYLQEAANQGEPAGDPLGHGALVLVIVPWTSCSGGRCWPGPTASSWRWWRATTRPPRGSTTCCAARAD